MRFAAVVPAAGLSSRMGSFKPLLDLGGKPLICHTLDSLRAGGAERIFVVTGHRAEDLEDAVAAPDVRFVRNPDYAQTGMLESVQAGLKSLQAEPFDCVFILPGDVPLVSRKTMEALKAGMCELTAVSATDLSNDRQSPKALRPSYRGRAGHPVLLNRPMAEALLQYRGPDGLRGFLRQQTRELKGASRGDLHGTVRVIETSDPGILADADTPEDFLALRTFT